MRAKKLTDLLKKGDKVAVSNITGREASKVTAISQRYGKVVVGGWALGKGGREIQVREQASIPVFSSFQDLCEKLPAKKHPNKIIVYSPPEAVYGDVKNLLEESYYKKIETIFIITENVAVEVAAKIHFLCEQREIDVLGCNTLGVISPHEQVRIGAVGGDQPRETFRPGCATIISNSGNMVNTMAAYLNSAGIGVRFGISTGKDQLILSPLKELLKLVAVDRKTKLVVLYVEPGGLYEKEAIEWMKENTFNKPILVYVSGSIAEHRNLSLGHAGAVVEGKGTSASEKMALFDEYFGVGPYEPKVHKYDGPLEKGIRIQVLHHLPIAARFLFSNLQIERDFRHTRQTSLNPWIINMGDLAKRLPNSLILNDGSIPSPYKQQFDLHYKNRFGKFAARINMRNASHASSNDGKTPRIYGVPLVSLMKKNSLANSLILAWTGSLPSHEFEAELVEMAVIASLSNGPGSISAQGAKLSASAGNHPNTAMIATLASIGTVHGGNGAKAVEFMMNLFRDSDLQDPYDKKFDKKLIRLVEKKAAEIVKNKMLAKEADINFERVPCIGHPVYRDRSVNYDPRERVISAYLEERGIYHVFLSFFHHMAAALKESGVTRNVLAVNVDAAIASVWLGICWPLLMEKKVTVERVRDIPFLSFCLGRAAGGVAEFLDHNDYGNPMDMRIPVSEIKSLTHPVKDDDD